MLNEAAYKLRNFVITIIMLGFLVSVFMFAALRSNKSLIAVHATKIAIYMLDLSEMTVHFIGTVALSYAAFS